MKKIMKMVRMNGSRWAALGCKAKMSDDDDGYCIVMVG